MPIVHVYNEKGETIRDCELDAHVFGVVAKPSILHDVVTAMRANARQSTAHTKDRGEVSGGGRKPWKQKGTGRARHGSIRSPIWKGGGVTFGPRNDRNYTKKINKKVVTLALRMSLSDKVSAGRFVIVDSFTSVAKKTKETAALLRALPVDLKKRRGVLLVSSVGEPIDRLARNIPSVRSVRVNSLNTLDVLTYHSIVITEAVAKVVEQRLRRAEKKNIDAPSDDVI